MKTILSAAILLGIASTQAIAATDVFESNAPGGDYADVFGATTNNIGSGPLGTTTIFGDLVADRDVFDALFFTIDAGTKLTSLSITTEGDSVDMFATLLDGSGTQLWSTLFSSNGTVDIIPNLEASLGPDTYNFGIGYVGFSDTEEVYWTTTSVVEVAPVPLPAGLPLLAAGLGALAFLRRKARA